MRIADSYVDELTSQASTTIRVLERVPEVHLEWRLMAGSRELFAAPPRSRSAIVPV
jgi:hypothetical protein